MALRTTLEAQAGAREISWLPLIRLAVALGAARFGGPLSAAEHELVEAALTTQVGLPMSEQAVRHSLAGGHDPLGDLYRGMRSGSERRLWGAFYTPPWILRPMVDWALNQKPDRLVDPGCGSGRYAVATARRRPEMEIVAVDLDPVATLLTRAALCHCGALRTRVINCDYTTLDVPQIAGRTAFVGNPPYVRHHDLSPQAKAWAVAAAQQLGCSISSLAGLHAYFYLATARLMRPGDVGSFVTSAEWLDVNYGATIRHLLIGRLGLRSLHLVDPTLVPFDDAMTTAIIACFGAAEAASTVILQRVEAPDDLDSLSEGQPTNTGELAGARRWSPLFSGSKERAPADESGLVPLRAIARVHRGVVTGANEFFVLDRRRAAAVDLLPWCRPAITCPPLMAKSGVQLIG
jgi:hypothetical protein